MLAIVILAISAFATMQPPVTAPLPRHCKGLDMYFYGNPEIAYAALKAGEIDLMCYNLYCKQVQDAEMDPNIQLAAYDANEYFGYDLNNGYTIPSYPDVRNPLNMLEFRQAIAYAVDKDYIVEAILQGYAYRIDVPIPYPQQGWWNPLVTGTNYPYEYDMNAANALLDAAGFDDYDQDGWRNYPLDWPGREGQIGVRDEPNLDPLIIYIRSDSKPYVTDIGYYIHYQLSDLRIPSNWILGNNAICYPQVFCEHDYHIYTSVWIVKKYQPLYWMPMFHSMFWYPCGPNYVTGLDESGMPNYPELDESLEGAYYATDMDSSMDYCRISQQIFVDECISIALFSPRSFMAYSRYLVGVVNMDCYGINNKYTYLNAYKVDNPSTPFDESQEPIKIGLPNAPLNLNPMYSPMNLLAPDVMYSGWQVMDETVYTHLTNEQPNALSIDVPWVAQDWEVSTWYDPQDDEEKTMVTYWIRKDVWWHAPVTGEPVQQFTAHDVEFSIWYIYAFDDGWQWHSVMDVHHTNIIDDFCIEVYFDVESMWTVHWIEQIPLFPKYEYLELLCEQRMVEFVIDYPVFPSDKMIFTEDQVMQVIEVWKMPEGIPLVEGVDFEIFATGPPDYCHNEIHWLRPLEPGEMIHIVYWTPVLDPHGYYLAGLDWSLTWYTLGTHFPVAIGPGVYAIFNCNPTHFLGAPPLGEIDWAWTWVGTVKPRSGYFQVNLYDAVMLLRAYCSRGDGPYNPNWVPGADIDASDLCHIGLYDAVTLLTNYGRRFGTPPDP